MGAMKFKNKDWVGIGARFRREDGIEVILIAPSAAALRLAVSHPEEMMPGDLNEKRTQKVRVIQA